MIPKRYMTPNGQIRWKATYVLNKEWKCRYSGIAISWRRDDGIMSRFGGGWQWKLGIQIGGNTAIISLLVMEISIWFKLPWKKSSGVGA